MGAITDGTGAVAGWEVTRPQRPSRLAGVDMAAFRCRGGDPVDVLAVPHPAVTLLLEFGDGPLVVDNGRARRGSLVARIAFGAVRVRGADVECVQVRLSPVVAHALFGDWAVEPGHAVVALDDLWGRDAARLRERLGAASSPHERFDLVDSVLTRRYEAGPAVDPEVGWAWHRITGSGGQVRVEDVATEVGWSRKRLWSRFRSQLGLPPKRAATLVRFHHAAQRLASGTGTARVAAEGGYVDQSHLHRDVLAFSGVTPAAVAGQVWLAVDRIAWGTFVQDPVRGARQAGSRPQYRSV
jgi:AraC-like DNA-binding protein